MNSVWLAAMPLLPAGAGETPSVMPLLLGVLFSAIGSGYSLYGFRQRAPVPLACGILLCAYPWVVDSSLWLLVIGLALTLLPWFWRPL
jgi:hypothetical protein